MATDAQILECPLCDYKVLLSDNYVLQLHFEQAHTTDSPFRIEDDPEPLPPPLPARPSPSTTSDTPSQDSEESVLCPEPDCGETILLNDFNDHLDYHTAETLSFDETTGTYHSHPSANMLATATHPKGAPKPSFREHDFSTDLPEALRRTEEAGSNIKKKAKRGRSDTSSSEKSTISRSILTFNPFARPDKKVKPPASNVRLGKSELGPHAWEDRMPKWLYNQLAAGPKISHSNRIGQDGRLIKVEKVQNETPGIIPILAQLSALDRSVKTAYYCHPSTVHIGKTPKEDGFCGYRNIQMLISYIQGAKAQGFDEFPGRTPGILKLQDLIEVAWDKGINEIGRRQTGGIRGTRKYIGTPEAQALFLSSEIDCSVEMFCDSPDRSSEAHQSLLAAIEKYFHQAAVNDDGSNVFKTLLPPIYLQQPGHSITIVGFERRRDGSGNLVVFDPMYSPSPAMHKLLGRKNIKTARPEVMWAYRRLPRQLRRHAGFEILMLSAHPPLFPAWDVLRQFPDCRFVYAFFRSRTLGYDVYPEDRFLRNFPWQQWGGLWIVDDARFARADKMNPLTAQALRRVTSEGTSHSGGGINGSNIIPSFHSGKAPYLSPPSMHNSAHTSVDDPPTSRVPSCVSSFDGSMSAVMSSSSGPNLNIPMLNMKAKRAALPPLDTTVAQQANLSRLTDVGRRYPGYPTSLSPTPDARMIYPSPLSNGGSDTSTLRVNTPVTRVMTPMSVDGSEMCDPSRRCLSHSFEQYAANMGLFDQRRGPNYPTPNASRSPSAVSRASVFSPPPLCSPSRSPTSPSLTTPTSPCPVSPRSAMLKNRINTQAFQHLSHQPQGYPASTNINNAQQFPGPSIPIANGTETSTLSPISPTGTMLSYISNRAVDSGLLAVRALSEAQVAEYRFWQPCGRRTCAFGCNDSNVGEAAAAKRLFKEEERVVPETIPEECEDEEEEDGNAGQQFGEEDGSFCWDGNDDGWKGGWGNGERESNVVKVQEQKKEYKPFWIDPRFQCPSVSRI